MAAERRPAPFEVSSVLGVVFKNSVVDEGEPASFLTYTEKHLPLANFEKEVAVLGGEMEMGRGVLQIRMSARVGKG